MTPKQTILALSILLLSGCGSVGPRSESGTAATAMVDAPNQKMSTQAIERKIIYTGDLDLVCDNLDSATSKLEAQVKAFNGYIGSATRATATGEVRTATWEIRVPSTNFSAFLKAIGSVGDVRSSSVKADDVSEEYYDAQAHLRNKQVEESRLLDLLKRDSGWAKPHAAQGTTRTGTAVVLLPTRFAVISSPTPSRWNADPYPWLKVSLHPPLTLD